MSMWFFIIWLGCGLLASGLWLWHMRKICGRDPHLWWMAVWEVCPLLIIGGVIGLIAIIGHINEE